MSQYIGARYTPDFQGTYDPTQSYENMVVVDNGMGTSYISRKPVPANTPLTDTEYWAIYGANNGAIINLQNQIDYIDQTEIPGLQGQINTINGIIPTLIPHDKRIIIITDSYGGSITSDNKTFLDLVAEYLDLDSNSFYHNYLGGAAFSHNTPAYKFLTLLQDLDPSITDKDTISDIIVVGGANDAGYPYANNVANIELFCDYCKTTYPNATVKLMCCGLTMNAVSMGNAKSRAVESYKTVSASGGIYITNSEYLLENTTLLGADLCHPSSDGVIAIARAVVQGIFNGSIDCRYRVPYYETTLADLQNIITLPSGYTLGNYSYLTMHVTNVNGNVHFEGCAGGTKLALINYGTPLVASGGAEIANFDFPDVVYGGMSYPDGGTGSTYLTQCVTMTDNNGKVHLGAMYFNGKTAKLYIMNAIAAVDNVTLLTLYNIAPASN